jgi:hypothetical protein
MVVNEVIIEADGEYKPCCRPPYICISHQAKAKSKSSLVFADLDLLPSYLPCETLSRGIVAHSRSESIISKTIYPMMSSKHSRFKVSIGVLSKRNIVRLFLVPKIVAGVLGRDKHNEDLLCTNREHARHSPVENHPLHYFPILLCISPYDVGGSIG